MLWSIKLQKRLTEKICEQISELRTNYRIIRFIEDNPLSMWKLVHKLES